MPKEGVEMLVTILTPTYNRAHTLDRLYRSLERQSCRAFRWLIVDDGSTDNTAELIRSIEKNSSIPIGYIHKKNGGKHTAVNLGLNSVETTLTFIVDSDDCLTEDAIKTIYNIWNRYKDNKDIGSIWFLQTYPNGMIVGDKFLQDEFVSSYIDIMVNSGIKGDKKAVYLTKARKEALFPIFEGERFLGEGIVHKKIGDRYKSVFTNKSIYVSEYQKDGLTKAGAAMRIKNPLGGMANSKAFISENVCFKVRLKKTILYILYGLFAKVRLKKIINDSEAPYFAAACSPLSFLLYIYWKKKYR